MIYKLFRPLIFKIDPEEAHALTLKILAFSSRIPLFLRFLKKIFQTPRSKPIRAFGLTFSNALGLAAGYDKNGIAVQGLAALGFGHIEVGTITPLPQLGNPKKRIFRLPGEKAIINRMGFPNLGAEKILNNLEKIKNRSEFILGINIGKNKDTPNEDAHKDYTSLISHFNHLADYFAINISSPNTLGLRELQGKAHLNTLLTAIIDHRDNFEKRVPLLVKLSPDLTELELSDALDILIKLKMDGIIATNTTIDKSSLISANKNETGGSSGMPLTKKNTEMVRKIDQYTKGVIPIIAVGGVMSAKDAQEKLDAGAKLVQVYTGLIYSGPSLVKNILSNLN
ncbi:MAG: quinone-dependent dihydroorotate dehydrogenase [Chloroflexi bacterium]|nr:quinone-dependent dihydroorotate dehydrogenase [Chloroflexota bacterium]